MKVFTVLEILNGDFPQDPNAFQKMEAVVREVVGSDPNIIEASLLGSAVNEGATDLSDVDLALVVPADLEIIKEIRTTIDRLYKEADKLHLTLDLIVISKALTCTTWHSLRPGFVRHIKRMAPRGIILGDNPASLLADVTPLPMSLVDEAGTYLAHKLETFLGWLFTLSSIDNDEACRELAKVLSATVHVERRMIELLLSLIDEIPDNRETPYDVTKQYRMLLENHPDVISGVETLWLLRQTYIGLFHRYANPPGVLPEDAATWRRHNIDQYMARVRELLEAALPESLRFLEANLNIVKGLAPP